MGLSALRAVALLVLLAVGGLLVAQHRSAADLAAASQKALRDDAEYRAVLARYAGHAARILAWTPVAGTPGWEGFAVDFCPDLAAKHQTCVVTHRRVLQNVSGAVLFSSTDLDPADLPARDLHQPWVLYSEVSPVEHPEPYHALRPEVVRNFDYTMSYRLDSDFPIPPMGRDLVDAVAAPVDDANIAARFADTQRAPVLWNATVCSTDNHRASLVQQLMARGVVVDTVGRDPSTGNPCPTNGRHIPDSEIPSNGDLVALMRRYKFVLALETSNCRDYVSRTLVRALHAGAIPIVDGPSNYHAFLPHHDAAIVVDAAPSVAHVAESIKALARDQAAYTARLRSGRPNPAPDAWRARWTSPKLALGRRAGWCGLCAAAIDAERHVRAEHAHAAATEAKMRATELALASGLAEVAAMREYLARDDKATGLSGLWFHNSRDSSSSPASGVGSSASSMVVNATEWLSRGPLPLPRSHVPLSRPPPRPVVAPDYSCKLAKWAPATNRATREHYDAQSTLPPDYLDHVFFNASAAVAWPKPLRPRPRRMSTLADLHGVRAAAELAREHGGRLPAWAHDPAADQALERAAAGGSGGAGAGSAKPDTSAADEAAALLLAANADGTGTGPAGGGSGSDGAAGSSADASSGTPATVRGRRFPQFLMDMDFPTTAADDDADEFFAPVDVVDVLLVAVAAAGAFGVVRNLRGGEPPAVAATARPSSWTAMAAKLTGGVLGSPTAGSAGGSAKSPRVLPMRRQSVAYRAVAGGAEDVPMVPPSQRYDETKTL
ncbi:hypothetical protein H9P43_003712 [Blastocladiella emersonii ATCC 22665]|nr:hypothetical protein H9P43_003712 [Blastocladiella emersonii ATCC 22665]